MEVSKSLAWSDLKLNPQLLKAIGDEGFITPTEIQQRVIPLVLGGQTVIGIAQTGTGKTAAYVLPILKKINFAQENEPRALVLAPTKELVIQIAEHARALARHTDLRIVTLYGGVGPKMQIEELQKGVDLLHRHAVRARAQFTRKHQLRRPQIPCRYPAETALVKRRRLFHMDSRQPQIQ